MARGAPRTNKRGEVWDETVARVHTEFPSTRDLDWRQALKDPDILGRLLHDVLRTHSLNRPLRRGHREVPWSNRREGLDLLRQLRGEDYSVLPFVEEFRFLAVNRSTRALANKVGLSRTQIQRFLTGAVAPNAYELEVIAAAFGKSPFYFREYRTAHVVALVAKELDKAPERTIGIVRHLGLEHVG